MLGWPSCMNVSIVTCFYDGYTDWRDEKIGGGGEGQIFGLVWCLSCRHSACPCCASYNCSASGILTLDPWYWRRDHPHVQVWYILLSNTSISNQTINVDMINRITQNSTPLHWCHIFEAPKCVIMMHKVLVLGMHTLVCTGWKPKWKHF